MGEDVGDAVPPVASEGAAAFLRTLGHDVEAAAGEGFDLRGPDVVVVVGDATAAVGLAELQRLAGVASVERLRAAAVALQPFGDDAVAWADLAEIALFTLTADGGVGPVNDPARNWTTGTRRGEPALRRSAVDGDLAAMTA